MAPDVGKPSVGTLNCQLGRGHGLKASALNETAPKTEKRLHIYSETKDQDVDNSNQGSLLMLKQQKALQ